MEAGCCLYQYQQSSHHHSLIIFLFLLNIALKHFSLSLEIDGLDFIMDFSAHVNNTVILILVIDWLVIDWLVIDWLIIDWLIIDWLVIDWLIIYWLIIDGWAFNRLTGLASSPKALPLYPLLQSQSHLAMSVMSGCSHQLPLLHHSLSPLVYVIPHPCTINSLIWYHDWCVCMYPPIL